MINWFSKFENKQRLHFIQYDKNGYCHRHGYKCIKGHDSDNCPDPVPNHDKIAKTKQTEAFLKTIFKP